MWLFVTNIGNTGLVERKCYNENGIECGNLTKPNKDNGAKFSPNCFTMRTKNQLNIVSFCLVTLYVGWLYLIAFTLNQTSHMLSCLFRFTKQQTESFTITHESFLQRCVSLRGLKIPSINFGWRDECLECTIGRKSVKFVRGNDASE